MSRPVLRVIEWDGNAWDDPSEDVLGDLLANQAAAGRLPPGSLAAEQIPAAAGA